MEFEAAEEIEDFGAVEIEGVVAVGEVGGVGEVGAVGGIAEEDVTVILDDPELTEEADEAVTTPPVLLLLLDDEEELDPELFTNLTEVDDPTVVVPLLEIDPVFEADIDATGGWGA